jgi:sugar/nucleoside kinase (ribokinase family)
MILQNSTPNLFADSEVCVVGAICRDVKTAPLPPGDYLLRDGETPIGGVIETVGGGGANSAAIAAALGAKARFAGVVGNDRTGERLAEALERGGVRPFLHCAPGLATGTTVNLVYASGQRHFLSCHPNNAALAFNQIDLAALSGARHLLRADIWFSEPMLYGGNEKLFREARRHGLAISLDLNWDPLWGHAAAAEIARRKEAVRNVLPLVDLAHGNVRELCEFAEAIDLAGALEKLAGWGAGAVVVHQGAEGAGYYGAARLVSAPAAPVKKRTMATGTGDVLSVCMLLLHHRCDMAMMDKLRLANTIVAEFMEGKRALIPELK